jgi:poly-beta-1,6-N-acetyl-D-glucosamine synthase
VRIVFWLSLIGILYTYAGYPVAIWLLAKLWPKRWESKPIQPSVSIILAVHNGIDLLPGKIQHLLDLDYPNIEEIIIVSDGSTDGTAELLLGPRPHAINPIVLREHVGKAAAISAGAAEATGEIILFVDIRPEIAQGAIQELVSNFADPTVGCVAGELILRQEGHDATSAAVGGLYWRYEQWIRNSEATWDSPVGVYGGFYAIRRELFVPPPAGLILDDMFQPLSIIRQGYRSVLDCRACVYDTWPKKVAGEFHRKVRTLAGNFQLFKIAPWTITPKNRVFFQLFSHKMMRLLVPYLMVLLLISTAAQSAGAPLYAAFATFQVLVCLAAVTALRYRIPALYRFAAPASALLVLNAAAVVGLYKFLFTRGPLWKIWNSPKPNSAPSSPRPEGRVPAEPAASASTIESPRTLALSRNNEGSIGRP